MRARPRMHVEEATMSGKVYKKIEIVGESETGISDAIASAIE